MKRQFKFPRQPAVRPYSEPVERDDDMIVDAGAPVAPRETEFVSLLLAETVADDTGDDEFPAYFDDSKPITPGRDALDAPVRVHTRKL